MGSVETVKSTVGSRTEYKMPELTEKPKKLSGEVPIFKMLGKGHGMVIDTTDGYGFMYKGVPVFLQKYSDGTGYNYNIYGVSGGPAGSNHNKAIKAKLDNIIDSLLRKDRYGNSQLDTLRKRFEYVANHPNEHLSIQEIDKKIKW